MPVHLTCVICGSPFSVIPYRAKTAKYCNYRCHQIGEGRKGGIVRAQQMKAASEKKSYIKKNGRHLHRTVAERKLGRKLRKGEIVHHIDGNKFNNHPDNLEVMTQNEHARIHHGMMIKKREQKRQQRRDRHER